MGVMNKFRDNAGAILIVLVFSFGVIWVLNDVGLFDTGGQRAAGRVIVVNGEGVTAQEYEQQVQQQQDLLQQQSPDAGPQAMDRAREQAFENIVTGKLAEAEMARLGLVVSDAEVRNLLTGPTPHPIIAQNFPDGKGGIDRSALSQFFSNPDNQPNILQLQEYLRNQRLQEKFSALVGSLVRVSDAEVVDAYNRQRRSATADVVALRYASIPDDSVRLDDRALRAFYDAHRKDFERPATWETALVSLSKEPSAQDSAIVASDLTRVRNGFASATDDSTFLAREGSLRPYSGAFVGAGAMDPAIARAIYPAPTAGGVVGPIYSGNEALIAKVIAVRPAEQPAIHARHILITAPDSGSRGAATAKLNALKAQIQGGASFEAIARANSQDPGSAIQGGDLGWFGRGQMVAPFENAAFGAAIGTLVGPVVTDYGVHLIEVLGRADQDVRLATFSTRLQAESSTLRRAEEKMEDFRYEIEQNGVEVAEEQARRLGLTVETQEYAGGQDVYPGIGQSPIVRRFLDGSKVGSVSDVVELDEKFVVVVVKKVTAKGPRPFEEVSDEVTVRARADRKKQIAVARMTRAMRQGFDGLAARVQGFQRTAAMSGVNTTLEGFDAQPRLAGAVFATAKGQATPVVAGPDAAFVARVNTVSTVAQIPAAERDQLRQQLVSTKRQLVGGRFAQALRESAEVEDNRSAMDIR